MKRHEGLVSTGWSMMIMSVVLLLLFGGLYNNGVKSEYVLHSYIKPPFLPNYYFGWSGAISDSTLVVSAYNANYEGDVSNSTVYKSGLYVYTLNISQNVYRWGPHQQLDLQKNNDNFYYRYSFSACAVSPSGLIVAGINSYFTTAPGPNNTRRPTDVNLYIWERTDLTSLFSPPTVLSIIFDLGDQQPYSISKSQLFLKP